MSRQGKNLLAACAVLLIGAAILQTIELHNDRMRLTRAINSSAIASAKTIRHEIEILRLKGVVAHLDGDIPCSRELTPGEVLDTAWHEAAHAIVVLRLQPEDLAYVAVYPRGLLQPGEETCVYGHTVQWSDMDGELVEGPEVWYLSMLAPGIMEPLLGKQTSNAVIFDFLQGKERLWQEMDVWCDKQLEHPTGPSEQWPGLSHVECQKPEELSSLLMYKMMAEAHPLVEENLTAIQELGVVIFLDPDHRLSGAQLACYLDAYDRGLPVLEAPCGG